MKAFPNLVLLLLVMGVTSGCATNDPATDEAAENSAAPPVRHIVVTEPRQNHQVSQPLGEDPGADSP